MLKHLMPPKSRSSDGCWTCRLRRKKCDESRPVCRACAALGIACRFGDEKPEWMDGGARQREMSEKVKEQVRRQAGRRRERRVVGEGREEGGALEGGWGGERERGRERSDELSMFPALALEDEGHGGYEGRADMVIDHDAAVSATGSVSASAPASAAASMASMSTTMSMESPASTTHDSVLDMASKSAYDITDAVLQSKEIHFIMMYVDYVFPHLFPHYRPTLLTGGRGWLLHKLQENKVLKHTTMSLSSYMFSAVIHCQHPGATSCAEGLWKQLQKQQGMALRQLQMDVSEINNLRGGAAQNLLEGTKVLQGIVQLLVFEVAVGNTDNWAMHLDAAIALFLQVVPMPEAWNGLLQMLGLDWPDLDRPGVERPYATEQAAFMFYTAVLFYIDIIASTTLARRPKLAAYHDVVLPASQHAPHQRFEIHLEEFTGVQNWAIRLVGEIAALGAWKTEQKKEGSLSVTELVARGADIERRLRNGLKTLDDQSPPDAVPETRPHFPADVNIFPMNPNPFSRSNKLDPTIALNTRVWASAAQTYLAVALSGWQPASREVSASVARTTELLGELSALSPGLLRGAVWPFCVTGCLQVGEAEREAMRSLSKRTGEIPLGTVRIAMGIMEELWAIGRGEEQCQGVFRRKGLLV